MSNTAMCNVNVLHYSLYNIITVQMSNKAMCNVNV